MVPKLDFNFKPLHSTLLTAKVTCFTYSIKMAAVTAYPICSFIFKYNNNSFSVITRFYMLWAL
jgi:hypothetical protein